MKKKTDVQTPTRGVRGSALTQVPLSHSEVAVPELATVHLRKKTSEQEAPTREERDVRRSSETTREGGLVRNTDRVVRGESVSLGARSSAGISTRRGKTRLAVGRGDSLVESSRGESHTEGLVEGRDACDRGGTGESTRLRVREGEDGEEGRDNGGRVHLGVEIKECGKTREKDSEKGGGRKEKLKISRAFQGSAQWPFLNSPQRMFVDIVTPYSRSFSPTSPLRLPSLCAPASPRDLFWIV